MNVQSKKLLLDVVEAGRSIVARCSGHSFGDYEADRWFRRTVEREFEIIGEPLSRLGRSDPATAAAILELPRILGFRNRIIRRPRPESQHTLAAAGVWPSGPHTWRHRCTDRQREILVAFSGGSAQHTNDLQDTPPSYVTTHP